MRVLAALALCLLASSQARAQDEGKKSVQSYGDAGQDQRAASSTPSQIELIAPNNSNAPTQQNQTQEADHAKYERRVANSTLALAILTGLLFIATGVLAGFTFRLWSATNELATDTHDAGARQLGVMQGQLNAMEQQGASLKESVATANQSLDQIRREFAVANRPRLRLRRIYFAKAPEQRKWISDGGGGVTEVPLVNPTLPNIIIEMANVGGVGVAKASLRVTFIIFNRDQPLPWKIQEELAKAVPQEMEISHGGSGVLDVRVPAVGALFYDKGVQNGFQTVYCIGYVEYTDDTATLMGRTGFIRRCDIGNGWFLPADKFPGVADFEYAD